MSLCGGLYSTWRPVSCGKCSRLQSTPLPERTWALQTAVDLAHEVRRLSRRSLPSDTAELARYLIGKTIVRKVGRNRMSGRIVETEAYPPGDRSGHAYSGRTARNQTLFLGKG